MIKLPLIGVLLGVGVLICAFAFPSNWNQSDLVCWRRSITRQWFSTLARLIGIRIQVNGTPTEDAALIVANHISWMDIVIIGALRPANFLSKIEVAHWPIVGYLARKAGTLFINRGAGAAAAAELISRRLCTGADVAFFPEGTTSDGTEVHRFHPRLFTPAIEACVPIQPIFITYPCKNTGKNTGNNAGNAVNPKAPYVSEDPFFLHALALMTEPYIDAVVHYTDPIYKGSDRKQLAEKAHELIASKHRDNTARSTGRSD